MLNHDRVNARMRFFGVLAAGRPLSLVLGILGLGCGVPGSCLGWQVSSNLTFQAGLTLREAYDSNVYLQDAAPNPANAAAARALGLRPVEANKGSLVTTILPQITLGYMPAPAFGLSAGYAPEIAYYHSARSEDYTAHRGTLNLSGEAGPGSWELANAATYIDGSETGPTFARPDDIPALGALPLRDRRAAFFFRNGFKLTEPVGKWFFRPVATSYVHDFHTEQHYLTAAEKALFSYENYIDRQEMTGGLDVGYEVAPGTHLVTGYRFGHQDQFTAPGAGGTTLHSPYGNDFHRALFGVEGSPAKWLKLAVLGGPDIREFGSGTPAGFDRTGLRYYWNASVSVVPTAGDNITLKSTRYEQPAFSSFSMYEDVKTDLLWNHRFNEKVSGQLGFTVYVGDWEKPVFRDDWIYTPNCSVSYAVSKHLGAELAYAYDWVDSKVSTGEEPLAKSHEFSRHMVSLSAKYSF